MSFNLLDVAKGLVTKELVTKASSFLGESETGVAKAFSGILPSLINGITEKASSSNEGAGTIANLAYAAHNSGFLNNIGDFFKSDSNSGSLLNKGAGILSGLFGDSKVAALTNLISNFSGIKSTSANSLLSMAAPILLGLLGKHASADNVNSTGLASLLTSQKSNVLKALPDGLNLGNVFSSLSNDIKYVPNSVASTATETTEINKGGGLKWLLPLLLLALVAAAAWYFLGKGCNDGPAIADTIDSLKSKTEQVAGDIKDGTLSAVGKLDSLTGDWMYDAGREVTIDLPNNAGKLVVGENSTENKLYKFLASNDPLDTVKGNWFEFTNVRFKTGGTQLDSGSMVQLQNMVAITKAFPKAEFKLGGYTDNTGDSAANVVLSQKRAEAVISQLKKLGVSATSISGAKGYGPQWPLADNATPEGRAQNRRVAVNVKAK